MGYPTDILSTRAVVKHGSYAIIPKDGLVNNVIVGIEGCKISILSSPKMGAGFAMYDLEVEKGGGTTQVFGNEAGVETFMYCIEGKGKFIVAGQEYEIRDFAYIYSPPGQGLEFKNTGDTLLKAILYKQRYVEAKGMVPYIYYGTAGDIPFRDYDKMSNMSIKDLLPADINFDMNIHILSFLPGGCHPFIETHVQEHGAYVLEGEGCYLIDNEWRMVKKGDFIWFGPYVTQGCYAVGRTNFTYIYSKDCNRDVEV